VSELEIVRLLPEHREWADSLVRERWGETRIVTRGRIHDTSNLPGFVALRAAEPVGLATFNVEGDRCEMVSLDSLSEGTGVGRKLKPSLPETGIDGIPLTDEIELELTL